MPRRFQFSLRTLILTVGYFAVFFAVLQNDQIQCPSATGGGNCLSAGRRHRIRQAVQGELAAMSRLQFSIRTLFWLMLVVGAFFVGNRSRESDGSPAKP